MYLTSVCGLYNTAYDILERFTFRIKFFNVVRVPHLIFRMTRTSVICYGNMLNFITGRFLFLISPNTLHTIIVDVFIVLQMAYNYNIKYQWK